MKIRYFTLLACIGLVVTSCSDNNTVNARIYERKHMSGDSLQIKYRYTVNDIQFTDSAIVENKVIPDDAIDITVDKNDPTQTIYKVEK